MNTNLCNLEFVFDSLQVRSKSKAAKAGLCEGDEVVSINGKPCGDLTYAEVIVLMESLTDSLQMLIKRYRNAQNALVQFCSVNHIENCGFECTYFADLYCELLIVLLLMSVTLLVCMEKGEKTDYLIRRNYCI